MYGCPRPIVTAFIPVGNECSSWRNEDSCYGRYQADPYVAKIKYWEGLKVPPDLEYCDGLLDRKVPFCIFHIQDLTKHTDFWLQYGWRSKEGWTSDFETKVYWSDWSNVQCSYTFLATFVSLSHFKLNCVKLCKRVKSFCPLCQIVKTFKSSFCTVRSTGWLRGHITQLRKFKSFMQVLHSQVPQPTCLTSRYMSAGEPD